MKLHFYVSDGEILSMHAGWNLWSVLMYGARGGISTAKRNAFTKDRTHSCLNYQFYRNPAEVWTDNITGHHAVNALGIFVAGDYTPPAGPPAAVAGLTIPVAPAVLDLKTIVKDAVAASVWDIHIGTCRERWGAAKTITPQWLG